MAHLNVKGRNIYYDITGSGEPILLLNGIMMSTKSWEPFVESFTAQNTLIRVDFFDQGQSDKLDHSIYAQDIQVEVIKVLLEHLNIQKINVVGISYGGEIAILYAIKYPEHIRRLILFNTTPYTSPWLAEIGHKWNAIGKLRDGQTYYQATIPVIYSPSFYESNLEWMKKRESILKPIFSNPEFLDAMERLTNSAQHFDVRDALHKIKAPTLIIAADEDYLTPISNQKALKDAISNAHLMIIPGVGHASMYEVPMLFASIVIGYVNVKQEVYQI